MGEAQATRHDVSRLFARAAFGATTTDLDRWTGKPYSDVVEFLLTIPSPSLRPPALDDARRVQLEQQGRSGQFFKVAIEQAQQWWLQRMRGAAWPLEERMVLFWHDHFATAYRNPYPDIGHLLAQNQLLRMHALGNFRDMLAALTVDPAMLYWLNGNENYKGKPNENYAREFFELFTLGTMPQVYEERDIREAARAFTGWVTDPLTRLSRYDNNRHDIGEKTVLRTTIKNAGDKEFLTLVDIALKQSVAPMHLAHKLVTSFAYLPATTDVLGNPDPLAAKVAQTLRDKNWSIKDAVRTMLLADEFRYADARSGRQIVRQPIDLVVSACKAVGVAADTPAVLPVLRRMGQLPFDPPNVGGWPADREWLSPVTTIARYDWGVACFELWRTANGLTRPALPASKDLDDWAARFGLARLSDNTRDAIERYLASAGKATEDERRAGVLVLLAASPDWMVT